MRIARLIGYGALVVALGLMGMIYVIRHGLPANAQLFVKRPSLQQPSSHFRTLDSDHDGNLTPAEWKAYYESRMDWPGTEWDFHFMDCNRDNLVTWPEYQTYRIHGNFCGGSYEIASRSLPPRPKSEGSWGRCVTDPRTGVQSCAAGTGSLSDFAAPNGPPMQIIHEERPPIFGRPSK
jgi:hypothetical protein